MTRAAMTQALLGDDIALEAIARELQFTVALTDDTPTVVRYLREAVTTLLPKTKEDVE